MATKTLRNAKKNKADEFYTQLADIENELRHYKGQFAGKKIKHIMGCWFTNLDTLKRHEKLPFYKKYNAEEYPKYDNYEAIEVLETALNWISNGHIEDYMSKHQHAPNANELWTYFKNVIDWVQLTFIKYRREMKGQNWGVLYDEFHAEVFNTSVLEQKISALMADDDVTNKKGVYPYVLTGKQKYLNLRTFTQSQKREAYTRQGGICPRCAAEHRQKIKYEFEEMEGDHITPWSQGGKTVLQNCQMLCKEHNRLKSDN